MADKGADVVVNRAIVNISQSPQTEQISGGGLKRTLFNALCQTAAFALPGFTSSGDFASAASQPTGPPGSSEDLPSPQRTDESIFVREDSTEPEETLPLTASESDTINESLASARLGVLTLAANLANKVIDVLETKNTVTVNTTTPYVVTADDDLVLCDAATAGGDVNITLPLAAASEGRIIRVKHLTMGGFDSRVSRSGSDLVETGITVTHGADLTALAFMSDGVSNWWIVVK